MEIYLVGGAVRDEILNKEPNDKDYVVVGSSVREMIALGFKQVGKNFPVFLHPRTGDEYALARKEIKTGVGYKDFEFIWEGVSLAEDLYRRDLTINAIAKDINSNEYIDPYNGINDLKLKVIRHVSNHFVEDPLRVLRVARFLTQFSDFKIADETLALCKIISKTDELKALTNERVWMEFEKALLLDEPSKYFEFLLECGALKEIFPELSILKNIPQKPKYHPEGCVWTHTMLVLNSASKISPKISVRFAALVHDLGKGVTPKEILPAHIGHEVTGVPIVKNVCERFKVPNNVKKVSLLAAEYHLRVHRCLDMRAGKVLDLIEKLQGRRDPESFKQILEVCLADNNGKLNDEYKQGEYLNRAAQVLKSISMKELIEKANGVNIPERVRQEQIRILKLVQK